MTRQVATPLLLRQAAILSPRVPPHMWNTQFRLTFNALPTDHRRAGSNMPVAPRSTSPPIISPYPCFFCHTGADSIRHLFGGQCPVVCRALLIISTATGFTIPSNMASALLLFPPTTSFLPGLIVVVFNWTVWHLRRFFFSALPRPPAFELGAKRLADFCLDNIPTPRSPSLSTSRDTLALALLPTLMHTSPTAPPIPTPARRVRGGPAKACRWMPGTAVSLCSSTS